MNIHQAFQQWTRQPTYHIRWMIRRDMEEVLDIETRSFEFPWSEGEFERFLRTRNVIGMVAEYDEHVVGYMVYELHRSRLHVVNFAVLPELCRQGVGTAMVRKLVARLSPQRRDRIELRVRETNLTAQLFFRAMGFRAVRIVRGSYPDTPEDGYVMRYRLKPTAAA